MNSFAERLRVALDGPPKLKQVDLAKACGIKPPSVSDWLNGRSVNIEGRNLLAAARFLNVRPEWLQTGRGPMRPEPLTPENWLKDIEFENNVGPGPKLRKPIPLISWVKAGDLCEAEDPYQPGDADEWLDCPFDHSPSAFCLRVVGDSMMPEYREGEVILVDPALCANHGDDVIVRTPEGKATFKRLHDTPDGKYLIAINPAHPDRIIKVPEGTHICGVVTGSWMQRRK
jgi:SOS-response transcriptional repressor LexA